MKRISILSFILGVVLTAGACSIHAQSAPQSKSAGLGVSLTIVRDDAPAAASTAPTPANVRQKALKKATVKPSSTGTSTMATSSSASFSVDTEDNGGWKSVSPTTEKKTANGHTFYRGVGEGTSSSDAHADGSNADAHSVSSGVSTAVNQYNPAVDYKVDRQVKGVKLVNSSNNFSASYPHNFSARDSNARCAGEGLDGVSAYCGPMSVKTQEMVNAVGRTAYETMLNGKKKLSAADRDLVFRMMQRQYLASYAEEHHYIFRLTVKDPAGMPMLVATYTNMNDCIDLGNAAVQSKAFENFACQKVEI
jgi:hypothetical protein